MLLNKKQIESSIIKNKILGLFEIKLPGIKRYFESIYYSFEGNNKKYGNLVNKFDKSNFKNKLVGISSFNNHYIFCFINLFNLESSYFFIKSFDVFEINLDRKKYSIFVYNDFENNIKYFSDYSGKDYSLGIKNNVFIVKNIIFETEVFTKNFVLSNILNNTKLKILDTDEKEYLDIIDFFIFDDFFIKSDNENFNHFYNFVETINDKNIEIKPDLFIKLSIIKYDEIYYPKIKFNLSILSKNINKIELIDIRKILLSFFTENISCCIINNEYLEAYFGNYIHDFTNLELDDLKLNFDIPNSIYLSDILFEKFKLDLLKLRYNLFLLKETYKLKDKKVIGGGEYIKLVNNRLQLNKNSLEKTILNYEKMLLKLLENLL